MAYAIIADRERAKKDFEANKPLKVNNSKRADKFAMDLKKNKIDFKRVYIPPGVSSLPSSLTFMIPVENLGHYRSETGLDVFLY